LVGDLQPGTAIGEYLVEGKVGEGSMGEVYRAIHPYIGKRAAIKVMRSYLTQSADAIARFTREAQAVGRLGHPNIIDAFSFGCLPDGRCYLVMEWLQGECLGDRLQRGPLTLAESCDVFEQVCHALESAHASGIIHRDLKPDNIFLAEVMNGPARVKLLDFGIAKLVDEAQQQLTRTGAFVGTPAYVSPEQARSARLDWRTDVYSLGVVVFQALTGRLPFEAPGMSVLGMHLSAAAPRSRVYRPDLPTRLDELIARMMEKDPAMRPMLRDVRHGFAELRSSPHVTMSLGTPAPAVVQAVAAAPPARADGDADMTVDELIASLPKESFPSDEAVQSLRAGATAVVPLANHAAPTWMWAAATMGLAAAVALAVILFLWLAREPSRPSGGVRAQTTTSATEKPVVEELARIKPPSESGAIVIMIDDPEAEVALDGVAVPRAGRALRVPVRDTGPHRVTITRQDAETVEKTVSVGPGQVVDVVVSER
jgi:serine/threonine protein kinase